MNNSKLGTGKMVRLAVLVAILIIFCYTPLGRIPIGPVFVTLNMIPVVIGAIVLGPAAGAILGIVFGLWSFSTCFGTDPFGTALVNQGFGTALLVGIMCIVPRFFAGWLPGFVYKWISKERFLKFEHYNAHDDGALKFSGITKLRVVWPSAVLTSLAGSLFNTIFFVGALVLFFANNALTAEMLGSNSAWAIITILVTSNAILEAIVCAVVGGVVARALLKYLPSK
ncbi:MAG: ECF transporter S component [Oscillospiraceae bacterium]|jgi:uncharacterized membrane protein|nr:ECF transporter S component [Oscillospiraceae bacterium]